MMALDPLNTLDKWPLPGIDNFVDKCLDKGVKEINVTGTNTDPLLYRHYDKLFDYLEQRMPDGWTFGLRTNGISPPGHGDMNLFDKASLTICSLNPEINRIMMGGDPPNLARWYNDFEDDLKVNIVLGVENVDDGDVFRTIAAVGSYGVKRVNLREPYGQPHVGNPIKFSPTGYVYDMPTFDFGNIEVCYWDVHYCAVESVNLYASGRVSVDYPITRGHHPLGEVLDQGHFKHGRQREQWLETAEV